MEAPTARLRHLLDCESRWTAFEHHDEVTSTSDVVLERAAAGAGTGLVVVAGHQTAGRGRAGRRWEDVPGGSLLVSVLLTPPDAVTLLPLAAGLAVRGAASAQGLETDLRWPNDVLAGGRKLAGILVEGHTVDGGRIVVVGTGINVDWRASPRAGAGDWTSIAAETGGDHEPLDLLADLLAELDVWLDHLESDPAALADVYRGYCTTIGLAVEADTPSGVVTGRASGIDERGALLLDTDDGEVAVTAGDVLHTDQRQAGERA